MMNIQIKPDKWYKPQEIANLLRRTLNETYVIIKRYGCSLVAKDGGILVSGKDMLNALSSKKDKKKQDV